MLSMGQSLNVDLNGGREALETCPGKTYPVLLLIDLLLIYFLPTPISLLSGCRELNSLFHHMMRPLHAALIYKFLATKQTNQGLRP